MYYNILGGAENQVLVTAAKSVTVADTYESFSVTKVLDAQDGNFYDNINSLSFRIQLGEVGDYVFIDNVTTTVTINGAVLNVEKNGLESFTMYPNPVNDILNIISVNDINETVNLSNDENYKNIVDSLSNLLHTKYKSNIYGL